MKHYGIVNILKLFFISNDFYRKYDSYQLTYKVQFGFAKDEAVVCCGMSEILSQILSPSGLGVIQYRLTFELIHFYSENKESRESEEHCRQYRCCQSTHFTPLAYLIKAHKNGKNCAESGKEWLSFGSRCSGGLQSMFYVFISKRMSVSLQTQPTFFLIHQRIHFIN